MQSLSDTMNDTAPSLRAEWPRKSLLSHLHTTYTIFLVLSPHPYRNKLYQVENVIEMATFYLKVKLKTQRTLLFINVIHSDSENMDNSLVYFKWNCYKSVLASVRVGPQQQMALLSLTSITIY